MLGLGAAQGLVFQPAAGMVRWLASPLAAELESRSVHCWLVACGCGAAVGSTTAVGAGSEQATRISRIKRAGVRSAFAMPGSVSFCQCPARHCTPSVRCPLGPLPCELLGASVYRGVELSVVETRMTPLALSLSRHRTVSSRDHEKFLSFQTTMVLNGGASPVASSIIRWKSCRFSWAVIVPGCDPEAVDVAVAFAFARLELSRVLAFGITGGFLDVDCGVLHGAASR